MRAIIIANGQGMDAEPGRAEVRPGDWIVAADGGAVWALAWGLEPDLVIGDMDSLPPAVRARLEAQGCRFLHHPRRKDETDLELALRHVVEQGAREIIILGAWGGRLDHALANVLLLTLPILTGVRVRFVAGDDQAVLVRGGETLRLVGRPGDLVSLLPLGGDAQGVTTEGLAWALGNERLRFGFSRGVSNEMTALTARVTVGAGLLLVVRHRRQR